jgi:hypothetical protein
MGLELNSGRGSSETGHARHISSFKFHQLAGIRRTEDMPIQGALPAGTQSSCGTGGIHWYLHFVRGVVGCRGCRHLAVAATQGARPPLSPTRRVKLASFKSDPLTFTSDRHQPAVALHRRPSLWSFLAFDPRATLGTLGFGSKDNWFPARGPGIIQKCTDVVIVNPASSHLRGEENNASVFQMSLRLAALHPAYLSSHYWHLCGFLRFPLDLRHLPWERQVGANPEPGTPGTGTYPSCPPLPSCPQAPAIVAVLSDRGLAFVHPS